MKKLLLVVLGLLFIVQIGEAQRLRRMMEVADTAYFSKKDYKSAIKYYKAVLSYDSTITRAKYNIAESARYYKAFDTSMVYYQKVLAQRAPLDFPLTEYYLASVYQQTGSSTSDKSNYRKAIKYYDQFIETAKTLDVDSVNAFIPKAQTRRAYCDSAMNITPTVFLFDGQAEKADSISRFSKNLNSPRSDFGLTIHGDSIFFTTMRTPYNKDKFRPRRKYAEIFKTSLNGADPARKLKIFGIKNQEKHIANITFNKDKSKVFYCECEYVNNKDFTTRCDIFYKLKTAFGWSGKKALPFNDKKANTTQPNIAFDTDTGKEILFFASDKGNERSGNKDIFYTYIDENNNFSSAEPLSAVNTEGDEMTPFYDAEKKFLYYSSNNGFTLGGADIFRVQKTGTDQWGTSSHLGPDVNTSYDEAFFSIDPQKEYAYWASDRLESQKYDEVLDACCFDNYRIPLYDFEVKLEVFDNFNDEQLLGAQVVRKEMAGGAVVSSDTMLLSETFTTSYGNDWNFENRYEFIVSKEGYYQKVQMERITPSFPNPENEFTLTIKLDPKVNLQLLAFDQETMEPLTYADIQMRNAMVSAGQSVMDIIDRAGLPGNSRLYAIEFGEQYLANASYRREAYLPDSASLQYTIEDVRGNYTGGPILLKDSLYLEKCGLERLVPDGVIAMYYDNDVPKMKIQNGQYFPAEPRAQDDFQSIFDKYKDRVKYYKARSVKDSARIKTFFQRELVSNYNRIDTVINLMARFLESGFTLNIKLVGYASPIGNAEYNKGLAKRRIRCVENLLLDEKGLRKYYDSGKLIIKREPEGEREDMDPELKRKLSSGSQGVYGYESIKERRVDIQIACPSDDVQLSSSSPIN